MEGIVGFEIEANEGKVVVTVQAARLDASLAGDFRTAVLEAVESEGGRVAVDLSRVEFLDSSGLGALVGLFKAVRASGKLVLCGVQEPVMKMLELSRMDRVFTFGSCPEDALA